MATPSKRRKTNSHKDSPQTVRSLDYFFGNQNPKQRIVTQPNKAQHAGDGVELDVDAITNSNVTGQGQEQELDDAQLARKLQEEWDAEARDHQQDQHKPQSQSSRPQQDPKFHDDGSKADKEVRSSDGLCQESVSSTDREKNDKSMATQQGFGTNAKAKNTLGLQSAASAEDAISSTMPFDESPMTFDPSRYLPDLQRHWATQGGDASYGLLTRCFILINSTQSRIKIVDTLVNFLRTIIEGDPESLLPAVWLATNAISPPYISLELGLGGSAISKALKNMCGLDNTALKTLYDKHGDAGDVAFEAKKRQSFTLRKPKPLSIKGVFQSLVKVANSKGTGSQEIKQRIVERLLQDSQGAEESRYLVRTLSQHLRIGAVKTTMLIALSRAILISKPPGAIFETKQQKDLAKMKKEVLAETYARGEELVKACFARRPNYNDLVPCLLQVGIADELLLRCGLSLHVPLRPMLGSITRDLGEMLTKLQGRDFSCEYKYDGQRAQVHCDENGKVSIFSRHLEMMTDKYPDLVALVPTIRGESVSSFILEGEVVAIDRDSGELKAFQTLTNRAKKDVAISSIKVDICLFAFDLMHLNGEELLSRSFRERRELLRSLFVEVPNQFTWVQSIDATSADSETVLEFFKSATEIKCEGIMVKVLDNVLNPELVQSVDNLESEEKLPPTPSKPATKKKGKASTTERAEEKDKGTRRKALLATYEPDKRLDSWLKVKKDYNTSADTNTSNTIVNIDGTGMLTRKPTAVDLIPIAGWHGQGRKAKWWSPILLAVRNPTTGSLEAVTKCISGFTDKFYQANKEKYVEGGDNIIARPSYVEYPGHPDVWFEPQEVWEMAFADITKSPTYLAAIGLVSADRGLSMRFPRFLKVREDKGIDEASTSEFLADLWRKQEDKGGVAPEPVEDDECLTIPHHHGSEPIGPAIADAAASPPPIPAINHTSRITSKSHSESPLDLLETSPSFYRNLCQSSGFHANSTPANGRGYNAYHSPATSLCFVRLQPPANLAVVSGLLWRLAISPMLRAIPTARPYAMDQTNVGDMAGYYGRQYSYSLEEMQKAGEVDPETMMAYMSSHGMDVSGLMGGQSLDEIILQNSKEMQRRQSFHQSQHFPTARLPINRDPPRSSSMLEFGGGGGNNGELDAFQFDPSAVHHNQAMQRPPHLAQRRINSQPPQRRDAPDDLALNTHFQNMGSGYNAMNSASPYPASGYDQSDPMSGLDMTTNYMNNNMLMKMSFSSGGLHRESSGEMSSMNMFSPTSISPHLSTSPLQQDIPQAMRNSMQDPGGGPMDHNVGDLGMSNSAHLQMEDSISNVPLEMRQQQSAIVHPAEAAQQLQSRPDVSEKLDPAPQQQQQQQLQQQTTSSHLEIATMDDQPISPSQNMAAQSVIPQYKNAYSSSGFDMLGVLMRVAARPKPQINIGAVDMSCAFVVCDVTQHDVPIVYCSDIFERLTGYTKHEILGRNCRFLQAPDGKIQAGIHRKYVDDQSIYQIKTMITARQEMQTSVINYRKGGQPFMNLLTMIPITWDSEEFKYYVGFQVDLVEQPTSITNKNPDGSFTINYQRGLLPRYILPEHHPQTNTELGQTVGRDEVSTVLSTIGSGESELSKRIWDKVLLENTDDVVHVLSLKGLFLYLSPSSRKVLEYDPSELVGTALSSVCHPSDIVPVTRELKDTSAGSAVNVVFRIRRKHNGYTWFESHGSLHLEQGKGRKCIIMVGRERPVYALARSDIDTAGGIGESELWTKMSTSGMFLFVSSNVRSLLDRQPEELVGTSAQVLMRKDSKLEFGRMLELARTGVRSTFKHDVQNKRGQTLQARTTIYPGDAGKGQKPTFLVAQTRLLKVTRHASRPAPTVLPQADQKSASPATSSSSLSVVSNPTAKAEGVTTSAGGNGLAIGTQHEALASEENVFDELKTTRSTSWQFELRQMEKRNRLLAEELQGLLSAKKKRKRSHGAGHLQKDCANCHTRATPEWRRGPSGNRDLCNSCGLRWAKENGRVSPRTSTQNSGERQSTSPAHPTTFGSGQQHPGPKAMPSLETNPGHAVNVNVNSHQAKTARMEAIASLGFAGGIPPKIEEGVES
ncbi:MAG: hypothetical protein Q9169_004027 [Polycauliona sp. 2 TL-2023]